jgi:hypothetical protein
MKRKSRKKDAKTVSASELAQMGVCERLVVFEHRFGKRHTAAQRAAIRRGLKEHGRFFRDGVRLSENKGRCYIATLVFGEGQETASLRRFRDKVLRPKAMGRWLICAYYRTAPEVCTMLEHCPRLQPLVRTILRPLVWMVGRVLHAHEDDHVA